LGAPLLLQLAALSICGSGVIAKTGNTAREMWKLMEALAGAFPRKNLFTQIIQRGIHRWTWRHIQHLQPQRGEG